MTILQMSELMSKKIPQLSPSQARHYLEGRFPRNVDIRDSIIDKLGLNRAYIEGWEKTSNLDIVQNLQDNYGRAIKSENYRLAQEIVGRVVLVLLDAARGSELDVDAFYIKGGWFFLVASELATNGKLVTLDPRDTINMSLFSARGSDTEFLAGGWEDRCKRILHATVTNETIDFTLNKIKNDVS